MNSTMMATSSDGPNHFSIKQLSVDWGVSARVVRHLIYKGALRAKRIGKEYRISREALKEFGEPPSSS